MVDNLLKRGKDSLFNGVGLGIALGLAIVFGQRIFDYITPLIPAAWQIFGVYSVEIIIVGLSALIGYVVDKY